MNAFIVPQIFTGTDLLQKGEYAVCVNDDGVISHVDPPAEVIASGMNQIELDGVLMPGLIDMHTHLCLSGSFEPDLDLKTQHPARVVHRALSHLSQHLDAGVTTIRDVGGVHGIDIELSRMVREGKVEGPDVWAAGHLICMTGGHACFMGVEADGPDAVQKAARQEIKAGAHLIKLIATGGIITPGVQPGAAQLSQAEMQAACDVAHLVNKKVAAHAQGTEGIMNALRAGCDTIEHGFWLSQEAIQFMHEQQRTLVPTFAPLRCMRANADQMPSFIQAKLDVVEQPQLESFQKAIAGGVNVVTGTDAGTPGNPHGNIAEELKAFAAAGVSANDVWRAATSNAAFALGASDRGKVHVGLRGDLICVSNECFANPAHYSKPSLVVSQGRVVRRSQ